ncbi:MAG TPA: hypothetical protein VJA18_05690 [Candidatus Nanoarchaeia archaeon]|nr:hypothetical protein [Candidatus Nanoarchaeia archaeon]
MNGGYSDMDEASKKKIEQFIGEHHHLLPTRYTEVETRMAELTSASYRADNNINSLEISAYEGTMPKINPTESINDSGVHSALLRNDVVRMYVSADGNHGFEYLADVSGEVETGEMTLSYILLDDRRKYKVEFGVTKKVIFPEDK